jgi:uncharacterized membrane protein YdjX (TVP38/TMEM64 family)
VLIRLIPFFPSKLANYFFGLKTVRLKDFTLGSLVGFIPFSVHNVYLESIAADLAAVGTGDVSRSPFQWLVYLAGFLATIITIVYLNRMPRRALARYTENDTHSEVPR